MSSVPLVLLLWGRYNFFQSLKILRCAGSEPPEIFENTRNLNDMLRLKKTINYLNKEHCGLKVRI